MSTPTALRDQGMTAAENAADPRVLLHVDAVIAEAIESGEPFSANDIRDRLPVTSRGLVGARVRAAAMRKEPRLEQVGEVRSTLPGTHAKKIAVWRKVDGGCVPCRVCGGSQTRGWHLHDNGGTR